MFGQGLLSLAVCTKSRVTMARPEYSESDIMTLAKRHDWNYIKTYLRDLGNDYGKIISFYRDQDDTTGTPCRVKMDICLTTGTVATCIEYQKRKFLGYQNARRIKQLEGQVQTLRKQVANNKKKKGG